MKDLFHINANRIDFGLTIQDNWLPPLVDGHFVA